jgi:hypothetical protein
MADVEALVRGVEVGEVAGPHVDGPDRQPRLSGIDAVEVDQPLERLAQRAVS